MVAVIFDWDGVVIDSGRQHHKSWIMLAEEENLAMPDDFMKKAFGMKSDRIISEVLKWTNDPDEIARLDLRKEVLYREIIKDDKIETLSGVKAFLDKLLEKKIPCAIGSSTDIENIKVAIRIIGLTDYFSAIIAGKDVENGKPHPEVFVKTAKALGEDPDKCIVVEDAVVGIKAAKAAGMKCIAVTTTNLADRLNEADIIVDSLAEVDIDSIVDCCN